MRYDSYRNKKKIKKVLDNSEYDLSRKEISDELEMSSRTVWNHLKEMKESEEIIVSRKVGRIQFYELEKDKNVY